MKGIVQHCVKSEIDVSRKEAVHVFLIGHTMILIGKLPKDKIIMLILIEVQFKII